MVSDELPENKISQNYACYDYTQEGTEQGFQLIGMDWRYAYVNDTVIRQYGFDSSNDLVGFTVMEKFPGICATEMYQKLEKAMYEGVSCVLEYELTIPLGVSKKYHLHVSPFLFGIVVLSTDITQRKTA